MNQRQLECFLAVAKMGNFSQAARSLHYSQSAISQQISSLEKVLNQMECQFLSYVQDVCRKRFSQV